MNNVNFNTVIYVLVAWIVLNIILPLFVNSIERLYKRRIDLFTATSISLFQRFFLFLVRIMLFIVLCLTQLLFIFLMLPTIGWVTIAERYRPQIFEMEILGVKAYADQRYIAKLVLKPNFWHIILDTMKKRKDKD